MIGALVAAVLVRLAALSGAQLWMGCLQSP
jgi:hypothetical protein